jgi:hypothetical protein
MQRQLVTKGCSDEVGAIGIETFLNQEVDVTQIDDADIDRHLLSFTCTLPVFDRRIAAFHTIPMESIWIPIRSFIGSCGPHQAFNHYAEMVRDDR